MKISRIVFCLLFYFELGYCFPPNSDFQQATTMKKIIFYQQNDVLDGNICNVYVIKDFEKISNLINSKEKKERIPRGCIHIDFVNYYSNKEIERVEFCKNCYGSTEIKMPKKFYNIYNQIVNSMEIAQIEDLTKTGTCCFIGGNKLLIPDILEIQKSLPEKLLITVFIDEDGDPITFVSDRQSMVWDESVKMRYNYLEILVNSFLKLRFNISKNLKNNNTIFKIKLKLVKHKTFYFVYII